MGSAWQLLWQDRKILVFPLISGLACLAVMAAFAVPLFVSGKWMPPAHEAPPAQIVAYYGYLFLFYYCNYFVIVFFNAALVSCAMTRMCGGEPTLAGGLSTAASRIPVIAGWALLAASVGLVLRIIEDRSDKVGRFIGALLGAAWTVTTYLVVPILVVEQRNPFSALKESTVLLKKTWGEQLMSGFGFGTVFSLLSIPAILMAVAGFWFFAGNGIAMAVCFALAVIYLSCLRSSIRRWRPSSRRRFIFMRGTTRCPPGSTRNCCAARSSPGDPHPCVRGRASGANSGCNRSRNCWRAR